MCSQFNLIYLYLLIKFNKNVFIVEIDIELAECILCHFHFYCAIFILYFNLIFFTNPSTLTTFI